MKIPNPQALAGKKSGMKMTGILTGYMVGRQNRGRSKPIFTGLYKKYTRALIQSIL